MNLSFFSLLVGAFVLEMAGYLAFPYLSLQLRSGFGFTTTEIGTVFLVAIWLRPLWSVIGGVLAERVRPFLIFAGACVAESICFLLLAWSNRPTLAITALIIGNLGFSLWSPNLFGLVYKWYPKERVGRKISLLTGSLNAGAAAGCVIGALLSNVSIRPLFFGAGMLFILSIPILGFSLLNLRSSPDRDSSSDEPMARSNPWIVVATLLISLGFWASYSQFCSFFALFANDWLLRNEITGFAFGTVAVGVAVFSFLLSRARNQEKRLKVLVPVSGFLFAMGWLSLIGENLVGIGFFVLSIALAESLFTIQLADLWARLKTSRAHLMQSLNFAMRNVAMGIGSFVGGLFYTPRLEGHSLIPWVFENWLLLGLSLMGLLIVAAFQRQSSKRVIYFLTTSKSGRILGIPTPKKDTSFLEFRSFVKPGDLILNPKSNATVQLGYVASYEKPTNHLYERFPFEIQEAVLSHPLKSEGQWAVVLPPAASDLVNLLEIEKEAWDISMRAPEKVIRQRFELYREGFLVAYSYPKARCEGFLNFIPVAGVDADNFQAWYYYASLSLDPTHLANVSNLSNNYVLNISVRPSAPRGVGTALMQAAVRLCQQKSKQGLYYGIRIPNYHQYRRHMNISRYLKGLRTGEFHEDLVRLAQNTGGEILGYREDYFSDPDSDNYGVIIRHRLAT